MELFNERELWQRSFSLSNIWSVTPNVHIDVEMVDCEPIFGKFVQNFFKLVGVVGDEDFGDLDRSLRRLYNVFDVSNSKVGRCCWFGDSTADRIADVLSTSVMVILFTHSENGKKNID